MSPAYIPGFLFTGLHRESPVSPMARHLKDRSAELGIRDSINLPGARPS